MKKLKPSMVYKLHWSKEAVQNLEEILNYLVENWSDKAVESFKQNLGLQLDFIIKNPSMFPSSNHIPRLRKAVLSKQTTVFYEVKGKTIYLAYLHVNRKDIKSLK
jgi:plasmid stabilization system protein ParE